MKPARFSRRSICASLVVGLAARACQVPKNHSK
jgi:hypothetical protein